MWQHPQSVLTANLSKNTNLRNQANEVLLEKINAFALLLAHFPCLIFKKRAVHAKKKFFFLDTLFHFLSLAVKIFLSVQVENVDDSPSMKAHVFILRHNQHKTRTIEWARPTRDTKISPYFYSHSTILPLQPFQRPLETFTKLKIYEVFHTFKF